MKLFAVVLVVCALAPLAVGQSQIDQATQAQSPKPSADMDQPMQRLNLRAFNGTITKNASGRFVLEGQATQITYFLDDQKIAKDFAGHEVIVHGNLIPPGSTIHVKNIERIR
jgi:hypothetical protein